MHQLRLYDPDCLYEVTLRCDNGAYRFDLNDADLRDQTYGVFAEALKRYAVQVFAFHFMSNHYHALYGFRAPDEFVAFLAFLHGNLARLGHRSKGTHGAFWSPLKVMAVSADAESVARRVRYIMGQAVAGGLVDHPAKFSGPSSIDAMLTGQPLQARRCNWSQKCRDAARLVGGAKPDSAYETWTDLQIDVPPCWTHLSPDALRRLFRGIADEVAEAHGQRHAPDGGECPMQAGAAIDLDGGECPAPKEEVPTRYAADGGPFVQGAVQPKDRGRRRSRPPRLYSVNPAVVAAFEERYKLAVQEYREAKSAWRRSSVVTSGTLRGAGIVLPAWMLLGTLPLRLERREAEVEHATLLN